MTASRGQRVEVQITSGRWSPAQIAKVVSGDTVNLIAFTDGVDPWPTVETPNGLISGSLSNVDKGTSVGQWRELAMPAIEQSAIATIAAGSVSLVGYATESYAAAQAAAAQSAAQSAASGYAATAQTTSEAYADACKAACVATPATCGSTVSLAINTARNPSSVRSDSRPTRVTAVVTWTATITGSASAEVVCDSSATPTTVVMSVPFSATLALGVGIATPVVIDFEVPVGWSYKVRAGSGSSGTVALVSVYERAL